MNHANKMILVPHELAAGENESAAGRYMSNLDQEMLNILHNKTLPIDAKVLQYGQILRRFQTIKQDAEKPIQLEIKEPKENEMADHVENAIRSTVPSRWQKQALLLLKYAQNTPHVQWSDKGEMIVDGNKIIGSNIVDLINDFSRTRSSSDPPLGADIFLQKLLDENIPKESIVNKKRLDLLKRNVYASTDRSPTPSSTHQQLVTPTSTPQQQLFSTPHIPPTVERRPRTRTFLRNWTSFMT